MSTKPHFTTRRGFIAALGFGGVSLYGLWAAYGAAPTPLALLGLGHGDDHGSVGHGGGHGAAQEGPDADAFNRLTEEFIERYRLPDGTVYPRILDTSKANPQEAHGDGHGAMTHDTSGDHAKAGEHGDDGHGAMTQGTSGDHAKAEGHGDDGHGAMTQGTSDDHAKAGVHGDDRASNDPIEVYLAAGMWYYLPAALRLDAGQPYRFRMMAVDVSHGASIQFGRGGRIARLRPGRLTELEITFSKPGRYLVYCTVYCGPAHDIMQATIEVV